LIKKQSRGKKKNYKTLAKRSKVCYNKYKIKDHCESSLPIEKSQKIFFVVLCHDCRRKGCKIKNHEKQCVFHGFLLFKGQKQIFLENG